MAQTWLSQLPLFGLVLARCAGVFALAPPTGWRHFPPLLRLGLATVLALPLAALLAPEAATQTMAPVVYLGLLVSNALTGALLGAGLWLLVHSFRTAGHLVDTWLDGAGTAEGGPLASFLPLTALLFFVQLDGLRWLLVFLRQGCEVLPVTTSVSWGAAAGPWLGWPAVMLATALRVAAPLLVALMLASAMAASLGRAVDQMAVSQLAPGLRFVVVLVGLGSVAPLLAGLLLGEMDRWAGELGQALDQPVWGP
ncbi:MAG: flagellar biosynthetic protein FliR [Armatimonadetes bacterium]|nr:flagellar biosynthetic protein FliR [Armatimonadota bacterium]